MSFEEIGARIGRLVDTKQKEYGNSHGQAHRILEVLYPQGIPSTSAALTITRVVDKLFRIANGDKGNESAWEDIAGYALLMCRANENGHTGWSVNFCPKCQELLSSGINHSTGPRKDCPICGKHEQAVYEFYR